MKRAMTERLLPPPLFTFISSDIYVAIMLQLQNIILFKTDLLEITIYLLMLSPSVIGGTFFPLYKQEIEIFHLLALFVCIS